MLGLKHALSGIVCKNGFSKICSVGLQTVQDDVTRSLSSANLHSCTTKHLLDIRLQQARFMSNSRKGFFGRMLDDIKSDMGSKEMKENLKKFREERDKLEQTEAIQKAREKFKSIESETQKSSDVIKQRLEELKEKVSETVDEVQKTEFARKGMEFSQEVGKSVKKTAKTIGKGGQQIGQSAAFRSLSEGVKAAKEEFEETTQSNYRFYRAPSSLRKRTDSLHFSKQRTVEVNEDASGVVLHKDSWISQKWKDVRDNNPIVTNIFDLKSRYDESEHVLARGSRFFTEKLTHVFGGVFQKTEMSEVLTEICTVDSEFEIEQFIQLCRQDIIPNILEAMIRADLDVLKDWCFEGPFNTISHPLKQGLEAGCSFHSKVLDINNVDVAAGKLMEQGPVIVISFNAQQINLVKDKSGKVIEGDPDKITKILYVWALCRDQEIYDPQAAWRLLDISASSSELMF